MLIKSDFIWVCQKKKGYFIGNINPTFSVTNPYDFIYFSMAAKNILPSCHLSVGELVPGILLWGPHRILGKDWVFNRFPVVYVCVRYVYNIEIYTNVCV
jgi:hypothetical protein